MQILWVWLQYMSRKAETVLGRALFLGDFEVWIMVHGSVKENFTYF